MGGAKSTFPAFPYQQFDVEILEIFATTAQGPFACCPSYRLNSMNFLILPLFLINVNVAQDIGTLRLSLGGTLSEHRRDLAPPRLFPLHARHRLGSRLEPFP
jgi:hypothetical protein